MRNLITLFLPVFLFSQTGYDIAKLVDERKTPKDMIVDLTMVLTNKKGKTRSSVLHSVSKDGGNKQMIWFLSPKDDKGVAFLKIEHTGKDDEMRLWLPAFKKVRRIASKQKGDSFMGSDLSYEDMTNRELDEYFYKLLGQEEIQNQDCYILESIPKPEVKSTYSRHVTWVTKKDYNIVKEESYDRTGRLFKTKLFKQQNIKNYIVLKEIFVENVIKRHSTLLTFDNIEVDTGIEDSQFQEKYLKRLPK
ncbi:MAG: outer membrane lipoprotein-sorting protein [Candidatus Marinimicrobia bacterium]|nr:outer membrane lipoprotein-sorting protein [Candidatus Neomarinimicrobiota bacterium]